MTNTRLTELIIRRSRNKARFRCSIPVLSCFDLMPGLQSILLPMSLSLSLRLFIYAGNRSFQVLLCRSKGQCRKALIGGVILGVHTGDWCDFEGVPQVSRISEIISQRSHSVRSPISLLYPPYECNYPSHNTFIECHRHLSPHLPALTNVILFVILQP